MCSPDKLRRNLRLIGWIQILIHTVALTIPALTFLWIEKGLTLGQVFILQALFALAVAALELPSGYLADILGRKAALVVALGGAVLGSLAYALAEGFWLFLIGELLWAVSLAFASGADYALFIDTLRALGDTRDTKKAWGEVRSNSLLVSAGCMVVGGILAAWQLWIPLALELVLMVVGFGLACSIKEPPRNRAAVDSAGITKELVTLFRNSVIEDQRLRWLLLFPAVLLTTTRLGVWLYQPYFALSGVSVLYLGFIWAAFEFAASMGSRWAYQIDKRSSERGIACGAVALVAVTYFGLGIHAALFLGILFTVQQSIRGATQVLFGDYLNQVVGSERRATFLSLQSMTGSMLYAVVIIPLSAFTDRYGVLATLTLNGFLTIVLGTITIVALAPSDRTDPPMPSGQ